MDLKLSNVNKPSNKSFKLISDVALYTLPLYSGAIMVLSAKHPEFALWFNFITSVIVVTLKGITKFTAEPDATPDPATV